MREPNGSLAELAEITTGSAGQHRGAFGRTRASYRAVTVLSVRSWVGSLSEDRRETMSGETTQACSTRDALTDMLETASRRLSKVLRLAAGQRAGGEEGVERAKEAVASLTTRLAAHRDLHNC